MLLHDSRSSRLIVSGKTGRTLYVFSTLKQFPALCEPRDLMGPVSEPSVSHFTPPYTSFFKMFFPSVLSFPHVITFAIGSDKNSWQHISVLPCMLNAHPISSLFHRRRNVCQSAGLPHALKPLFFFSECERGICIGVGRDLHSRFCGLLKCCTCLLYLM